MDLKLSGRVALVAGGSKGIGRAIALALAKEGVDTAIGARDERALQEASEAVAGDSGRACMPIVADLATLEGCQRFVAAGVERFGRVDILVCTANYLSEKGGTWETISDEGWLSHMELKFFSAVRCARESVAHMKRNKWGRIVLISGMATRLVRMRGMDNGPICAAMTNFGKQLAQQVAGDGIRVNTVHPDFTRTDLLMNFLNREAQARGLSVTQVVEEMSQRMPIGRLIEPREIANLVVYLCSDAADAITGQSIAVDGGAAMSVHY
jgi:NAD(P)-dependent dehydrogenase (short-subunit alcohol dehydrogenase family)